MTKLTLEDIRECNNLTKEQMAMHLNTSVENYEYIKDHAGSIPCAVLVELGEALKIGIQYIKI